MAEHICRKILAVDEFYFAQRPILGRGRGCAATWKANKNGRASEIVSTFIPEYEFPGVSAALEGFDPFFFSMRTLSVAKKKDDIINRLNVLANSYEDWIQKKLIHDSKMDDAKFKKEIGDTVINKCIEALGRIRAGIQLLVEDDTAFDAFCFMNRSMILQRNIMNFSKKHGAGIECAFRDFVDPRDPSNNFGWRPFQIAFILINLKGIVDPEHDNREVVDLLYFPTGGGKTEAYLGLMAFVIANRRLRAEENDEYNRDGGVTAILRYSLLDELEMRWEDEQKLNGLSSVHSMGFRQFIFYLAHKVDFIAEIFLCTMILFGNVGAQPAASFLLKFASFAKFLKQPESLCCFCTNQIFNFFSCNTAVFQCILKNE